MDLYPIGAVMIREPFVDLLLDAAKTNSSLLCVGLDPDPGSMPGGIDALSFNRAIIEATSDLVCAYKPNLAFYEALGSEGFTALKGTLEAIPKHIPVIGDAKRGDVGNTAAAYARAMFEVWGFDAVTVHPYIGWDSVEPFARFAERGVLVLCRTSNSASEFQGLSTAAEGDAVPRPLYERVALAVQGWNCNGNLGLVVGATHPEELQRVRGLCPNMPILIPGVGAQGGDLEASVRSGVDAGGKKAIISSSRQVLYASDGAGYAEEARRVAEGLRVRMQQSLPA